MNVALFIYLAEAISNIGMLIFLVGITSIAWYAFFTMAFYVECNRYHHKHFSLIIGAVCMCIACFIPSSKTMYMMAGAVIGEKMLESETGKQVQEIIKIKLQQELDKIKPERN